MVKRNLKAGETLRPSLLKQPKTIKKGQKVSIIARSGSLQVSMPGKALDSGHTGDHIRIRNLSSKRVIEGRIIGPDQILIAM